MDITIIFSKDNLVEWIVAIATVILALVAIYGETYREFRRRPIIKVAIGNELPEIIPRGGSQVFRMRIVNGGKTTAKNCHAKIISVNPENPIRNFYFEPDSLKWSSAPRDMRYRINPSEDINQKDKTQLTPIFRELKDISPNKGWEFCDLFEVSKGYVTFASSGDRPKLKYSQSAIVTVKIFGDNIKPKVMTFRVSPSGDWIIPVRIDRINNTSQSQSDYTRGTSEESQHPEQSPSENEDSLGSFF